jgi:hypothetical protein
MPTSMRNSASPVRRAGVGLGGVIASLAAVAVIAGVAIPTFFARHAVTLDNAAILLARDLRSVQNRAAHLGQSMTLQFDANGWRAFDAHDRPLKRFASEERIERRLDADAVFEGVTLEALRFGAESAVHFDASGRPDRGGSLEVVYRGERRRLELSPIDGRVALEGLERAWSDEGL